MEAQSGIFGLIVNRMSWLTQRQKILAENVTHADTPGYRPRDLAAPNFGDMLKMVMVSPTTTQPNHIRTAANVAPGVQVVKTRGDETSIDGNSVDLESEMMKVSSTVLDYQAMTSLLKKWQGMIRTAMGRA